MDRTYVILIAQVFNGCLLPLFASCLLLCLNDREFMAASPQSGLANLPLVACVTLTFVFTANVLLQVTTDHSSHIATVLSTPENTGFPACLGVRAAGRGGGGGRGYDGGGVPGDQPRPGHCRLLQALVN